MSKCISSHLLAVPHPGAAAPFVSSSCLLDYIAIVPPQASGRTRVVTSLTHTSFVMAVSGPHLKPPGCHHMLSCPKIARPAGCCRAYKGFIISSSQDASAHSTISATVASRLHIPRKCLFLWNLSGPFNSMHMITLCLKPAKGKPIVQVCPWSGGGGGGEPSPAR